MNYYEKLGVRQVINGQGTMSYLGGNILPADVLEVWIEASRWYVHMDQLQERASAKIAQLTGAEAGLITAGADAGLTLAICACIAGQDPEVYNHLPATNGLKNQVILPKICTNSHNFAFWVSGAQMVYVGTDQDFTAEDISRAVNDRTAVVAFLFFTDAQRGEEPLKIAIQVAHQHDLPIVVDAAAETPPRENIRRLIELGSDLVAYSGGKDIAAPNDTGILYGRKDLIEGARLQMRVLTPFGMGRSMKVGREDIAATVYALERYMSLDMTAHRETWKRRAQSFIKALGDYPGTHAELVYPDAGKGEYLAQCYPRIKVVLDEEVVGIKAEDIGKILEEGDPSILIGAGGGQLGINPHCLVDGEEILIAERLKKILNNRGLSTSLLCQPP